MKKNVKGLILMGVVILFLVSGFFANAYQKSHQSVPPSPPPPSANEIMEKGHKVLDNNDKTIYVYDGWAVKITPYGFTNQTVVYEIAKEDK